MGCNAGDGTGRASGDLAALRVVAVLLIVVGAIVGRAPTVLTLAALGSLCAVSIVEFRRHNARWRAAARRRMVEIENRNRVDLTQSRMLRDWVVRQQQFLDGVVASIRAGVIAVNPDGVVTTVNRASEDLLGEEKLEVGEQLGDRPGPVREALQQALGAEAGTSIELISRGIDDLDRTLSVDTHPVADREGRVLGAVAALHDITEHKTETRAMRQMALQDDLTGLPNRTLLHDRLELALARASRGDHEVAVLFIDLDGFKRINDLFGHDTGDAVLRTVSRRLLAAIRPEDTAARLGGDEFVVVCEGTEISKEAEAIARRITDEMTEPIEVDQDDQDEITVGCSVGIAVGDGSCIDIAVLLASADEAMYEAKQRSDRAVVVLDERAKVAAARELFETELHQAILRHELVLEYQPVSRLRSNEIVGIEALVRWNHPIRGRLGPAEFLPVAEKTGLIITMGRALLAEACSVLARADQLGLTHHLRLHVNLSARQLLDRRLDYKVIDELERTGLVPERLCLEIREQDVATMTDRGAASLRALAGRGVLLAVDDFGSGAASVTMLRRHPFSVVKIDPTHVARLTKRSHDDSFVRAVVDLADNLGLEVIAEGIETELQRSRLEELGCAFGQGFQVARPGAAELLDTLDLA